MMKDVTAIPNNQHGVTRENWACESETESTRALLTDPELVRSVSVILSDGGGHSRLGAMTIARLAAVILFT